MTTIKGRRERGAAAVEMAIVLPLLVLLIGGIVDFGRAYFTQVVLANAAREGVRALASSTYNPTDVTNRTNAALNGLTIASATIDPNPGTPCTTGGTATLTVSYDFEWFLLPGVLGLFGAASALPDELEASASMRCT